LPDDTFWALEPHTRAKHEILRRHLDAWLPIMASANDRIMVFDFFAGPGRYLGGEQGSPIVALGALAEHAHLRRLRAGQESASSSWRSVRIVRAILSARSPRSSTNIRCQLVRRKDYQ